MCTYDFLFSPFYYIVIHIDLKYVPYLLHFDQKSHATFSFFHISQIKRKSKDESPDCRGQLN